MIMIMFMNRQTSTAKGDNDDIDVMHYAVLFT
jgi:hypothetical protein